MMFLPVLTGIGLGSVIANHNGREIIMTTKAPEIGRYQLVVVT
jgi:hypothetical protein